MTVREREKERLLINKFRNVESIRRIFIQKRVRHSYLLRQTKEVRHLLLVCLHLYCLCHIVCMSVFLCLYVHPSLPFFSPAPFPSGPEYLQNFIYLTDSVQRDDLTEGCKLVSKPNNNVEFMSVWPLSVFFYCFLSYQPFCFVILIYNKGRSS